MGAELIRHGELWHTCEQDLGQNESRLERVGGVVRVAFASRRELGENEVVDLKTPHNCRSTRPRSGRNHSPDQTLLPPTGAFAVSGPTPWA